MSLSGSGHSAGLGCECCWVLDNVEQFLQTCPHGCPGSLWDFLMHLPPNASIFVMGHPRASEKRIQQCGKALCSSKKELKYNTREGIMLDSRVEE